MPRPINEKTTEVVALKIKNDFVIPVCEIPKGGDIIFDKEKSRYTMSVSDLMDYHSTFYSESEYKKIPIKDFGVVGI
jgi:hypothetical protein